MGTISDKLTYLNTTKSQLKDMINYGLDDNNKITNSTTFRNYVTSIFNAFLEALRTPDTLFTNLPKKSGSGANITLNDTANAPMRITLGSRALEQETTTGKNKLNTTQQTFSFEPNTTNYQNVASEAVSLVAGTKYYISYTIDNATTGNVRSTPRLYLDASNYYQNTATNRNLTKGRKVDEYTPSTSGSYQVQYWLQGSNEKVSVSDIMISTSSDTTYEPYTGGIPAPNPSYPQDIHTISGSNTTKVCGRNIIGSLVNYRADVDTTTGVVTKSDTGLGRFFDLPLEVDNVVVSFTASDTNRMVALQYDSDGTYLGRIVPPTAPTAGSNWNYHFDLSNSYKSILYISNQSYNNNTNFQIEYGTTASPYEAPTLETKDIDLKSKNLFNNYISTSVGFARCTASYDNGVIVLDTTGADAYFGNVVNSGSSWDSTKGQLIEVEPSTKYTLSISNSLFKKNFVTSYDENKVSLGTTQLFSNISTITTPATAKYVSLRIGYNDSVANGTYRMNIQFEKGETATEYKEFYDYGECGSIGNYENIPIRTFGKNMFDKSIADAIVGYFDTSGNVQTGGTSSITRGYIPIKPNTNMTISGIPFTVFCFYDNNKNFVERIVQSTSSYTFNKNAYYIRIQGATSDFNVNSIMLNEGSTALPYEPYGNGTWYLKQEIGKLVLDGTEDGWTKSSTTEVDRFAWNTNLYLNNAGSKCNYFTKAGVGTTVGTWFNNVNIQLGFCFTPYGTTTLEQWKTWLGTHNLELYQPLVTPTYTPITGTLAEQLENVYQKMLSQKGVTNISQVNNDLSFNLSVSAIENLD